MHVVWLTIDGLQPAYLGPYGCEWIETPAFDRLAARGVVFDWHFAGSPNEPPDTAAPDCPVGRDLRSARKLAREPHAILRLDWPPPIPLRPAAAIDVDDEETFSRLQEEYAAGVIELDEKLASLSDELDARGWGDAGWIVTSARGFPLGEHGVVGFPGPLHEELIHVPLIIAWPGGSHAGRRVSELTATMDLAAAIHLFFADGPSRGPSPLPPRDRILIADGQSRGIRTRDWYLLRDASSTKLFVKPDDRWEVNDVASQHEDVVTALSEPRSERAD